MSSRSQATQCRKMLCGGSKSFYLASFALPGRVRQPATALYAFCRVADDAIDNGGGMRELEDLRLRLELIYRQQPIDHPADMAFAEVVREYDMPRELPEALLEGMLWDLQGREYHTLSDVYDYSTRVAGTVGAMMSVLMGARTPALLARATDLGVAMQLTNIARDVGEDARTGRLYLPRDWLLEEDIDPEDFLHNPRWSLALGRVVQRLLDAAEQLYRQADRGIDGLPFGCQFGIRAARTFYAEIGHELERRGLDSVSQRAVVPTSRKLWLALGLVGRILLPARSAAGEALPEARYLVDAAMLGPREPAGFFAPLTRALVLLDRLERRNREIAEIPGLNTVEGS